MRIYKDPILNYLEFFNEMNGVLIRTNIVDENGKETIKVPNFRSYPELIDIGIMGNCSSGNICKSVGIDCYQGNIKHPNMKFSYFKNIIEQSKGKTFQIALGGKGDPNKYEYFKEALEVCSENGIVPNLTTSGVNMLDEEVLLMKKYCGAVAVSWYSKLILIDGKYCESNQISSLAVNKLIANDIRTNIHFVVNNENIDELIIRLRYNLFPQNINALILLLYKAVGNGIKEKCLNYDDPRVDELFEILKDTKTNFKIGFDTCFTPLVRDKIKSIANESLDYCESGRFSCYISSDYKLYSCSFLQALSSGINLRNVNIQDAWLNLIKNRPHNKNGECIFGLNKCILKKA